MYIPDVWPLYNSKIYNLILNFIFDVIGFILAVFHTMIYDPWWQQLAETHKISDSE